MTAKVYQLDQELEAKVKKGYVLYILHVYIFVMNIF